MEFVIKNNGIGQEQNAAQEQFINTLSEIESTVALLQAQVAAINNKNNNASCPALRQAVSPKYPEKREERKRK